MSTKTTFKRIALVAVAALGLGMLSSVPALARTSTAAVTLGTPTANVAVVGQATTISTSVSVASSSINDTFVVSSAIVAQPVGSSLTNASFTPAGTTVTNFGGTSSASYTATTTNFSNTGAGVIYTLTGAAVPTAAPGSLSARFSFTPAVPGTYTVAVFLDGAADVTATGAIKAADTVRYISVTALAAPATRVAITQPLAGSVATDATGRVNGAVLKIQAQDAAGASTRIDGSQQVLVNLPSGVSVSKLNGSASTATTQYGIVAASFDSTGAAYINVNSATAGTYAITAGLAGSATLSTVSVTFVTPTGVSAAGTGAIGAQASASAVAANAGVSGGIYTAAGTATIQRTQTSTTITAFATTSAARVMLTVTDTNNRIFGNTGGTALAQDLVATAATTASVATATDGSADKWSATFTIPHAALALSSSDNTAVTGFTVSPQGTSVTTTPSALNMVITGVPAAAGSAYWDTAIPTSTYLVVNGGTITVAADLYNQYGVATVGAPVTARVTAGRNLQATATALITDATGEVKFTLTDAAPTSATTFDTITFSNGTVSGTVTINYVAALTATTMTTSPSATTTTALSPADLGAINTATATASTGRDSVTATLLDASGVAIVGMPVTLTVPAGVEFHSTTPAVAYTNASGVATWSVFTTKAGTYKFTATGGGLTRDFFAKWTGSNGRVVSVTAGTPAAGSTPVTIKVADAYGNGVSGVSLTVSATGGYFLGLPLSSSVNTNAEGEIRVAFIGSGTVTATGAETQMFHAAGFIGTTAAAGWPAGVSTASATVDSGSSDAQVAADAAAEATDAANAATDAANAAAEAADAATAAAQDAADAVAALSTQVTELVSALRKQITSLTNLVIKIQRKVRA